MKARVRRLLDSVERVRKWVYLLSLPVSDRRCSKCQYRMRRDSRGSGAVLYVCLYCRRVEQVPLMLAILRREDGDL